MIPRVTDRIATYAQFFAVDRKALLHIEQNCLRMYQMWKTETEICLMLPCTYGTSLVEYYLEEWNFWETERIKWWASFNVLEEDDKDAKKSTPPFGFFEDMWSEYSKELSKLSTLA